MNYITFNGVRSDKFNIGVSGEGAFNAPARKISRYSIPGRNGDVVIDEGAFENIEVKYPAYIARGLKANIGAIRRWLLGTGGYLRLSDTFDTRTFRLARLSAGFDLASLTTTERGGTVDLVFDCRPQRYFSFWYDSFTTLSATDKTFSNDEAYEGNPLIKFELQTGMIANKYVEFNYAAGTYTAKVSIAVPSDNSHTSIYVDTETMEAWYEDGTNAAAVVSFEGDATMRGETTVRSGGTHATAKIAPRWWTL